MVVISPQIQAAEMRRREFVVQGIQEQRVVHVLRASSPRHSSLSAPRSSRVIPFALAARYTLYLLTSLATVAFGLQTN
jgi:hypothetical protein